MILKNHFETAPFWNGAYGIRTHGLLNAIQARSQLRQCPNSLTNDIIPKVERKSKKNFEKIYRVRPRRRKAIW